MEMYSVTPSYVKLEYIKKWSQLLLAWINKCIKNKKVYTLNIQNIRDAIEKYKEDLTQEAVDEMVHCGDVEVLLDFKYPGLKLKKYNNAEDYPRKVYIMTSALLFYLCVNSRNGQVINDICNRLVMTQQEILLRFCENLKDTAISYHTIEMSIAESLESAARDSIKADLFEGETSYFEYSLESSKISPTPTKNVKLKSQPSVLIQVNPSEYSRASDPGEVNSLDDSNKENTLKDQVLANALKDGNNIPVKDLTVQDKGKSIYQGQKKAGELETAEVDLVKEKSLKELSQDKTLDSQSQVKRTTEEQSKENTFKGQVEISEVQHQEKTLEGNSTKKASENKTQDKTLGVQINEVAIDTQSLVKTVVEKTHENSLENQIQEKTDDRSKTKTLEVQIQAKVTEDYTKTLDDQSQTQNLTKLNQETSLDDQIMGSLLREKSQGHVLKEKYLKTLKDQIEECPLIGIIPECKLTDQSQEINEGQIQKNTSKDQSLEKSLESQSQATTENPSQVTSVHEIHVTSDNQSQATSETQSEVKSLDSPIPVRTINDQDKNVKILQYVQPEQSILYSQTSCFGCSMDKGKFGAQNPKGDKSVKSNPSVLVQVNPNAQSKDKSQTMVSADPRKEDQATVISKDQAQSAATIQSSVVKGQSSDETGTKSSSSGQAQSSLTTESSEDKGQKSLDAQKSFYAEKSLDTQKSLDARKSLDAEKSLDAQKSLDDHNNLDAQKSLAFLAQKSLDAQKSLNAEKSLDAQKSLDARKSMDGQKSLNFQISSDGQNQVSFSDQPMTLDSQGQEVTFTILDPETGQHRMMIPEVQALSREEEDKQTSRGLSKSVTIQDLVMDEEEEEDMQPCDMKCTCGAESCIVLKPKDIPNECFGKKQWDDEAAGDKDQRKPSVHPEDDLAGRIPTCPRRGRFQCTKFKNRKHEFIALAFVIFFAIVFTVCFFLFDNTPNSVSYFKITAGRAGKEFTWQCVQDMCKKLEQTDTSETYTSRSRCELLCANPPLWPQPTGETTFSREIVAITIKNLEYKFATTVSANVQAHLSEAFKHFLSDLDKLENTIQKKAYGEGFEVLNVNINIDVTTDADHKLHLTTDESYYLETTKEKHVVQIKIIAASFCGARHALETLRQLMLLDLYTGYLITLSQITIQDGPFHKLRGVMISTNKFIPLNDMVRTLEAMAMSKFNTFHWRMPLKVFRFLIPTLSEVFDALVYTKQYVENLVQKADSLGIRILIEVGSSDEPGGIVHKINNCENSLKSQTPVFVGNLLSVLHENTLEMTAVNDIFHMSSIFSSPSCFDKKERKQILRIVLNHLQVVNHGVFPKMPVIWHSDQFQDDIEEGNEEHLGLQVTTWPEGDQDLKFLNGFPLIFSVHWDLSCEMDGGRCSKYNSWQQMYASPSMPEALTNIVGGEALLWTDMLKDDDSIEEIIWPRAAAVGERLWSFSAVSPKVTDIAAQRLDLHRLRMVERKLIANELGDTGDFLREEERAEPTTETRQSIVEPDYENSKIDKT